MAVHSRPDMAGKAAVVEPGNPAAGRAGTRVVAGTTAAVAVVVPDIEPAPADSRQGAAACCRRGNTGCPDHSPRGRQGNRLQVCCRIERTSTGHASSALHTWDRELSIDT